MIKCDNCGKEHETVTFDGYDIGGRDLEQVECVWNVKDKTLEIKATPDYLAKFNLEYFRKAAEDQFTNDMDDFACFYCECGGK